MPLGRRIHTRGQLCSPMLFAVVTSVRGNRKVEAAFECTLDDLALATPTVSAPMLDLSAGKPGSAESHVRDCTAPPLSRPRSRMAKHGREASGTWETSTVPAGGAPDCRRHTRLATTDRGHDHSLGVAAIYERACR